MLNEIKSLRNNLTPENLSDTFDAYERLSKIAPRSLLSIGKKDKNAADISMALSELLDAMRNMHAKNEAEYYGKFDANQYEG